MATHSASDRHDEWLGPLVRILGVFGLVVLGLVVAGALAIAGLNTDPGRRFVAQQIAGIAPESGLRVRVGTLDGSLFGRLMIRDVAVSDPKGVFATSPELILDWRPAGLVRRYVDIRSLTADRIRVLRLPELKETPDTGEPILPDIDIDVGRVAFEQIIVERPVMGRAQRLRLTGTANIADRRARIQATARSTAGDRLIVDLDAAPDHDRFDIDAGVTAPAGGLVTTLAGIEQPLAARISGDGSWSRWQGRATASVGGTPAADLRLTATDGRFALNGSANPGVLLGPGAVARLTAPQVAIAASATASERVIDTSFQARSDALALSGRGRIDLARSRFGNLVVTTRLLKPSALFDEARGRDVRFELALDGPFSTPTVDYAASAAAIGFGETLFEQLQVSGRATLDRAATVVPIAARARRVTGVNEVVGGLLTNLSVNGKLRVTPEQIVSDDIVVRSDRLAGSAVLAYSFATGDYDVALKGRLNRYAIEGLGLVDLTTDARLVPDRAGGFRLRGSVLARTIRLDNRGVHDFLGGLPVVSAQIERAADGTILIRNAQLRAPELRVDNGRGVYRPDGRLSFAANAISKQYGPIALTAEGPATRPVIRIRAARPNVGVALTNVVAVLTPTADGYAVDVEGGSPYGRFDGKVGVAFGGGPLGIDVARFQIAGIIARGRLQQTAAGPFAGTLGFAGSGLSGSARLSAAGSNQRADVSLRAAQARLALAEPVTIAEGAAQATLILYPDAPVATGSATLEGVRRGTLLLSNAKASGDYRGGRGTAQVTAAGTSGVPFAVSANAALAPDRVRLGAQGTVNRIGLKLAAPAEIVRTRSGWRLQPTTILLPEGRIELAGQLARDTSLTARLADVDLSIAGAFSPRLRLDGTASGTIDATLPGDGSVPRANANLRVAHLTRAGVSGVSLPVDVSTLLTLGPTGGDARAVVRRQGAVVGRLQARLAPLPGTASQPWNERLLAAPLSGGIRYNGPADVLLALSGVTGQELRGPLAIGADFGGRVSAPLLRGVIRASDLRYENLTYGTVLDDIRLDSRFSGSSLELTSLTATAGHGTLTASGRADLSAERGFPLDVRLQFAKALVANSSNLRATITGPIQVTNSPRAGARVTGDLRVDEARYRIIRQEATEVPALEVRRRGVRPQDAAEGAGGPPSVWALDLHVRAPDQLFVEGMGLESEWKANLKVDGNASAPRITGPVDLVRGTYSFAGRRFDLSRGAIRFAGEVPVDPTLDVLAETRVEDVTATVAVTGTATNPQIAFGSTPALPQDEILARLLFGGSVTELSPTEALQLAAAANSLRGSGGGLNPLGKLRQATGFDRLRVLGADEASGRGTALAAGKYVARNVYVEVTTDAEGNTATQLEINLTRSLKILSQVGAFGSNAVGLRYGKEY